MAALGVDGCPGGEVSAARGGREGQHHPVEGARTARCDGPVAASGSTPASMQTFRVSSEAAEVDDVLRSDDAAPAPTVEVHPDVSFRRVAHTDVLPSKRAAADRSA